MAIVTRGTRRYRYGKSWVGGRCVSTYEGVVPPAGSDDLEELLGWLAAERRADEDAWKAERARLEAEDRAARDYCRLVGDVARAALEAIGYHQHKRGEWRMSRAKAVAKAGGPRAERAKAKEIAAQLGDPEALAERLLAEKDVAGIGAVADLAKAKTEGAMTTLRALYRRRPAMFMVSLYDAAAETLAVQLGRDDDAARELVRLKLNDKARELAGPEPSPLEAMLARRVAFCAAVLERYEERHIAAEMNAEPMTFKMADYHRKKLDSASGRFLAAARALAVVRRLQVPAVQVGQINATTGPQQVNNHA